MNHILSRAVLITVLSFSFISQQAWGLDCSSENIFLSTQVEVDNFQTTYGGGGVCDNVVGDLLVWDSIDITNVDGLANLTTVGGFLVVYENIALTNVDGLANLTSIGGLFDIQYNAILTNVDGLAKLTSVGGYLIIEENAALTNVDGLAKLTGVGGYLSILFNDTLTNLDGLANLTSVGEHVYISFNDALTNLDGLANLTSVVGNLEFVESLALTSVNGLANITSVGGQLVVFDNDALTNVDGLANLTSVGGELLVKQNDALTNVGGLANVTSVGGDLNVSGNELLTNVDGLANLISVEINVYISKNSRLSFCNGLTRLLDGIDDGQAGPGPGVAGIPDVGGAVTMENNVIGCNSVEEVLDSEPSSFLMNAGLNDAWFYEPTTGQGFFITVFPDIEYVSLSWFTYDTERPSEGVTANLGDPGHRWLNALGPYSGNQAVMDISITSGGIFDTPTEVTEIKDGTIVLTFSNCENGLVEYDIPSINQQGVVPIKRVVGDNIALCEAFEANTIAQQSATKQKTDDVGTLSWDAPVTVSEAPPLVKMNAGLNDAWFYSVTNGQGFFINVFPDIEYVLLSWFTYDTERPPEDVTANLGDPGHRWLNALGSYTGVQSVMDITITSGGIFDTPTEVTEVKDGTITLTFSDCENGLIEYDIPSINQQGTIPIERVVGDNIALCEALSSD